METVTAILLGGVVILAFDTLGSFAARRFDFTYSRLMVGSFAIYVALGFVTISDGSIVPSVFVGAMIGLIESTVGWAISWRIGPGRPSIDRQSSLSILGVVVLVTAIGAVFGGVGGWLRLMMTLGAA